MKTKNGLILLLIFGLILAGCKSSHIIVAYESPTRPRQEYRRIVVAGIVNSENDKLRKKIEKAFADGLKELGYDAVPAFEEFGPAGIAEKSQEETYRKLCGKGIDAVITIALVDKSKEKTLRLRKSYGYPSNYYYNRVWNYKNILADLTDKNNQNNSGYFWESILFDLLTLEAQCTIQTPSFKAIGEKSISRDFAKQIIRKMAREKVLIRKNSNKDKLKAF